MERGSENKLVMVVRRTRLDGLISKFNTEEQARFYVEHLGQDFSDYQIEDKTYKDSIRHAESILGKHGRLQVIERSYLTNFIFGPSDTVIALGQDGLVANILKYLDSQLLIGVNPDPSRWEGVLLPFTVPDLNLLIPEVFNNKRAISAVTMAQATLSNGETLFGVNDIFIGPRSHTSARYRISSGGHSVNHSSSGIIVSTGLGSTGWLRSILAGATGIVSSMSQSPLELNDTAPLDWDTDQLQFSVREPWPSTTSSAELTFGKVTKDNPLVLVSHMPENGVIFSDGMESDYLQFNSGTTATISLANKQGRLVT